MNYVIREIDKRTARDIVVSNHYTHKWTSCRYALGLFDGGEIVGVLVFGYPIGRRVAQSISPCVTKDSVLELTRLWLHDKAPKNSESWFVSRALRWLKSKDNAIQVVISYSDPLAGHKGTVYQACNFLYQGNSTMLVKGWLHLIHGELLHPRTVVARYGTTSTDVLSTLDPGYQRVPMKKKHRYIYVLRNHTTLLSTLKHPIKEYPKNNDESDWK